MFLCKRKNGYYFIQYQDITENKIKRTSTKTKRKAVALKFLSKFQTTLTQESKIQNIFLKDFVKEYHHFISDNYSKKYLSSVELSFRKLQEYFSSDIHLKNISVKQAQEFITSVFKSTKSGAALYYRTLKAAFNRAIEWDYINENPFVKIKLPKYANSLPTFIDYNQFNIILANTDNEVLKKIFITAYYSGMRLGEIVNLKWDSLSFQKCELVVKNNDQFTTKNKRERIIPINKILLQQFQELSNSRRVNEEFNYIFKKESGFKFTEEFVSKQFKKAIRKSNLNERLHFHSLRHSFASNLVQKGASLYVVKELLGHESISTTQIYAHLKSENLFKAIDLL